MKYDLLLSDMVAYIVGFLGLIAAVAALQIAVSDAVSGLPQTAAIFGLLAVVFSVPARKFLFSRPYHLMIAKAWRWQGRIPFVILNSIWVIMVTAFLIGTKPEGLFGAPEILPWLFSPPFALIVWLLFALVFILPGLAFRQFQQTQLELSDDGVMKSPGLITKIRQSQNTILIDVHPGFEIAMKVADWLCAGLIALCCFAFLFSDTHVSLAYLEETNRLIWPTALVLFLCIYLPKNYGIRIVKETGDILYSAKRKLANAGLALALGYALAHAPYFYLIPYAYNKLLATEDVEIAYQVVGEVSYSFCRDGLRFSYPGNPEKTFQVCDIDPNLRSMVQEGDTVFIRGKFSNFGHSAEVLRLRGRTTGA